MGPARSLAPSHKPPLTQPNLPAHCIEPSFFGPSTLTSLKLPLFVVIVFVFGAMDCFPIWLAPFIWLVDQG